MPFQIVIYHLVLVITTTIFSSSVKLRYSDTPGVFLGEAIIYYIVYTRDHQLKTGSDTVLPKLVKYKKYSCFDHSDFPAHSMFTFDVC